MCARPTGATAGDAGRTLLKHAVAGLKQETGLDLMAAFEHEFRLTGGPAITPQAFSLQDFRAHQPFCGALVEADGDRGPGAGDDPAGIRAGSSSR